MATIDDEEDFGLSSSDEAEILKIVVATEASRGIKRVQSPIKEEPRAKRLATEAYSTESPLAKKILTNNFRITAFRLKQEAVVARLLEGGSAVVVFPTGGGKSLCYQVPALAFGDLDVALNTRGSSEGGITLVVSPLIALMKDQVDALVRLGIKAATLDSTKTRDEYLHTCEMLRNGELKLLYCAPERLNNEGFVQQMRFVRGGIRLIAIDEAHCISEWGHAFRPDYLKVSRFIKEINAERVVCLTATATPRVAQDICDAFDVDSSGLFRTSTYRPNLSLLAESAKTKQDLYPRLFKFLRDHPGPTIVYVTLQKQTEALAHDLRKQGFSVKAFHAGMQTLDKTEIQEEFMKSSNLIIVATIAFGMGIDKADIRNVVHFNIPSSLESYSQEIGRSGRDGKKSNCLFYVCGEDLHLRELFARGDLPSQESVSLLLKEIFDKDASKLKIGDTLSVFHSEQEKKFDIRSTTLKNIYAQLELREGLFRATTPIYTKYSYKLNPQYSNIITQDMSTAAVAIKNVAVKAKIIYRIDVDKAAESGGISRLDLIRTLNNWNEARAIELMPSGVQNVYRVMKKLPDTETKIEAIAKSLFTLMQEREQQALARTDEMLGLITREACFSRSLTQHFGDDLPDGKTECGHCTWCLTHKRIVVQKAPPAQMNVSAFKAVLTTVAARDDARFLARVAFGISSPRVTTMKLSRNPVFGSMDDHGFMVSDQILEA
jgi:RecQ family ATP-dependent DNA helicase